MSTEKDTIYSRVPSSEDEQDLPTLEYSRPVRSVGSICKWAIIGTVVLILSFLFGYGVASTAFSLLGIHGVPPRCENPAIRREWRVLSTQEKDDYLAAVKCLQSTPSRFGRNQSAYDDFPWMHSQIRGTIHETAAFLAWHRYYIHVFETSLHDLCNFDGHLPYWNWGLDWEDFTKAPVWDDKHGFGGNGTGAESMGNGNCVTTGPFANLNVLQFGDLEQPHCLSRGFLKGDALWEKSSSKLMPSIVEDVLDAETYEDFNIRLELGPHLAIPHGVNGDFIKTTAPYDPVFYLHHGQLDRLWWLWQQKNPATRLMDYGGDVRGGSDKNVGGLDDILEFHGLAPDIAVRRVMNANSGDLFCYEYR